MEKKLVKFKTANGKETCINLDMVLKFELFESIDVIEIRLIDVSFIRKECDSLLEAQMIYAKLQQYFGVNEELSEIIVDSFYYGGNK